MRKFISITTFSLLGFLAFVVFVPSLLALDPVSSQALGHGNMTVLTISGVPTGVSSSTGIHLPTPPQYAAYTLRIGYVDDFTYQVIPDGSATIYRYECLADVNKPIVMHYEYPGVVIPNGDDVHAPAWRFTIDYRVVAATGRLISIDFYAEGFSGPVHHLTFSSYSPTTGPQFASLPGLPTATMLNSAGNRIFTLDQWLGGSTLSGLLSSVEFSETPCPLLNIEVTKSGSNFRLAWPNSALRFALEQKDDLGDSTWTPVGTAPTNTAGQFQVFVPDNGGHRFYRLRHPGSRPFP